jgi:hypothetical protein
VYEVLASAPEEPPALRTDLCLTTRPSRLPICVHQPVQFCGTLNSLPALLAPEGLRTGGEFFMINELPSSIWLGAPHLPRTMSRKAYLKILRRSLVEPTRLLRLQHVSTIHSANPKRGGIEPVYEVLASAPEEPPALRTDLCLTTRPSRRGGEDDRFRARRAQACLAAGFFLAALARSFSRFTRRNRRVLLMRIFSC